MQEEHGIQNAIRNDLAGHCLAFRANVGQGWTGQPEVIRRPMTVRVEPGDVVVRKARRFSTGLPVGFSDLFGLLPGGRFFAMEVKTRTGRASRDQSNFLAAVERNGGLSGIVRSGAEALRLIGREP